MERQEGDARARTATAAWSAAAPSLTAAAAGVTCRGSSTKRRPSAPIAGTGMADWPVTYEELEPYYTQAEWEMGISGERVNSRSSPRCRRTIRCRRCRSRLRARLFKIGAAKLGWSVVHGPIAIISKPLSGTVRVRELRHVLRLRLPREGAFELRGHHAADRRAHRQLRDSRSLLRARNLDGQHRQGARASSTSTRTRRKSSRRRRTSSCRRTDRRRRGCCSCRSRPRFPDGLANSSGVVGRIPDAGQRRRAPAALFEHPLNDYKGVVTGAGIVDFVDNRSEARLLRRRRA